MSSRPAAGVAQFQPSPPARAASAATYVAFIGAGFTFASWASRIPQVRDKLGLEPTALGLVLLVIACGSLIGLPLSGRLVARFGSRAVVTFMALLQALAIVVMGVGYLFGVVPLAVGLFLFGFANGAWDVGMNVQGALVERLLRRDVMSRYHAGFSVGTVGGALIGTGMVALAVPVTAHLIGAAVLAGVVVPLMARRFVTDDVLAEPEPIDAPTAAAATSAWKEPRTLLIGVLVLAFAFAEGVANDWIAIAVIDGYGAGQVMGTLGFAVFLAAMTVGRWVGPSLLARYGRVGLVRGLAVLGIVGVGLFILGPTTITAFLGAVLWGLGASLGFPVGMSAGADDSKRAAPRVSVIATIGYGAFLGGPPLIGLLGHQFTVLYALSAVAVLLVVATLVSGNLKPLVPVRPAAPASQPGDR